jgi:hypothetical protein
MTTFTRTVTYIAVAVATSAAVAYVAADIASGWPS